MLDFHSSALQSAHARFLSALSVTGEAAMREHAAESLEEIVAVTYPISEQIGQKIITSDILKVVKPKSIGKVSSESVAVLVERHRRGGHVRRGPAKRYPVRRSEFRSYRKRKFKNIGMTAGGWNTAVEALGGSLPTWITDNPGEGQIKITVEPYHINITATNAVPWVGNLKGLPQKYGRVVQASSGRLHDRLQIAFKTAAAASGF